MVSLAIILKGDELQQDEVPFDAQHQEIELLHGRAFFPFREGLTFYLFSNGAQSQTSLPHEAGGSVSVAGVLVEHSDLQSLGHDDRIALIGVASASVVTYGDLGRIFALAHVQDRLDGHVGDDEVVVVDVQLDPQMLASSPHARGLKYYKTKGGRSHYGIVKQRSS